jgi:hypothetical protein
MIYQEKIFTERECESILKFFKDKTKLWSNSDRKYRSTSLDYSEETKWVFDRLKQFFEKKVGIEIKDLKTFAHFHRYEVGDWFGRHTDVRRNRMYAVGICLNSNYRGGNFILHGKDSTTLSKEVGNTYLFDVNIEHEITLITKGERYSIIWFLENSNLKIEIKSLI